MKIVQYLEGGIFDKMNEKFSENFESHVPNLIQQQQKFKSTKLIKLKILSVYFKISLHSVDYHSFQSQKSNLFDYVKEKCSSGLRKTCIAEFQLKPARLTTLAHVSESLNKTPFIGQNISRCSRKLNLQKKQDDEQRL